MPPQPSVRALLIVNPNSRKAIKSRSHNLDLVILGGGDGTISSVAETLVSCRLAFAVLPLGTANDLARSLGVAGSVDEAFSAIIANHRQAIDLGTVDGRRYRMKSMHLAVGNGRYYGGGNVIGEDACINDGRLSLYSLSPQKVWKLLLLAPLLRTGGQATFPARSRAGGCG